MAQEKKKTTTTKKKNRKNNNAMKRKKRVARKTAHRQNHMVWPHYNRAREPAIMRTTIMVTARNIELHSRVRVCPPAHRHQNQHGIDLEGKRFYDDNSRSGSTAHTRKKKIERRAPTGEKKMEE